MNGGSHSSDLSTLKSFKSKNLRKVKRSLKSKRSRRSMKIKKKSKKRPKPVRLLTMWFLRWPSQPKRSTWRKFKKEQMSLLLSPRGVFYQALRISTFISTSWQNLILKSCIPRPSFRVCSTLESWASTRRARWKTNSSANYSRMAHRSTSKPLTS